MIWSTRKLDYLDSLILDALADQQGLQDLHNRDILAWPVRRPLGANDSLPVVFENSFRSIATRLTRLWSMNASMTAFIASLQADDTPEGAFSRRIRIAMHVR